MPYCCDEIASLQDEIDDMGSTIKDLEAQLVKALSSNLTEAVGRYLEALDNPSGFEWVTQDYLYKLRTAYDTRRSCDYCN